MQLHGTDLAPTTSNEAHNRLNSICNFARGNQPLLRYARILRGQKHPWRFLAAKILAATGLCRLLTIRRQGYRLRFYASNLSSQFWIDPLARDQELEFYRAFLKVGDTAVDVGANIGDTALTIARAVGTKGKVWAIEPHPRIFRYLLANCESNDALQVTCENVALGNTNGTVSFSDSKRDDMNHIGEGVLQLPILTLDSLLANCTSIALLKIDVEGHEISVLEGALSTLPKTQCISFEAAPNHYFCNGYRARDSMGLLRSAGFCVFRSVSPAELQEIDEDYVPDEVENLMAVRDISTLVDRTGWTIVN